MGSYFSLNLSSRKEREREREREKEREGWWEGEQHYGDLSGQY